jgi:thioredoxin
MVKYIRSVEEYLDILKSEKLVIIDFTAKWCGPCKLIAPKFEEIASKYSEKIDCYKIDVDELEEITIDCNVSVMPTFQFYKEGKKIDEFTGASSDLLKEKVQKLLQFI